VLSRATTILAALFMVTSLALTVLRPGSSSVLDKIPATAPSPAPAVPSTTAPANPVTSPAAPVASQPAASPATK
jgi:preprotein translocase subunit SecG